MDKVGNPILFSMLGNFTFLVTFLMIGPVPFVPVQASKGLIQVYNKLNNCRYEVENKIILEKGMMALAGMSYAALVVSSFSRAQRRVLDMGFADDIHTYVMISGRFPTVAFSP